MIINGVLLYDHTMLQKQAAINTVGSEVTVVELRILQLTSYIINKRRIIMLVMCIACEFLEPRDISFRNIFRCVCCRIWLQHVTEQEHVKRIIAK